MRRDLSPSQIAVQAAHAVYEAASLRNPESEHPHFVLLGIRNVQKLEQALDKIKESGIALKAFYEPDIGNQLTAFATEPVSEDKKHLFKKFNCLTDQAFQWEVPTIEHTWTPDSCKVRELVKQANNEFSPSFDAISSQAK